MNKIKKFALTGLLSLVGMSLSITSAFACTGIIVGKNLTEDGSVIIGRTEDLELNHNKTFVVKNVGERMIDNSVPFVDPSNGFSYPQSEHNFKYTAIPDVTPQEGMYDAAGINEKGVVMTATVSAKYDPAYKTVDPYLSDGLTEAAITTLILPRIQSAREGIELIANVIDEKGAGEGNIVVLADKDEVWYMEILSGHQYAAIKFPDDKFGVFPNAFYLGTLDGFDEGAVIQSEKLKETAIAAGRYVEQNGSFHIANSYNPIKMSEGNRSRVWSGIKAINPNSTINYDDDTFELLQSMDGKVGLKDVMKFQRNRLEGTDFIPSDEIKLDNKGNIIGEYDKGRLKYPIGNINTMEAHIFQIKESLPTDAGAVMWLAVGSPLVSPYIPYMGTITDTHKSYQVTSTSFDENSWYWNANSIAHQVFGDDAKRKEIQNQWQELEDALIEDQLNIEKRFMMRSADFDYQAHTLQIADDAFNKLKALDQKLKGIEPKTEEPKTEEPKTEEPKVEEPKTEKPSGSETTKEDTPSPSDQGATPTSKTLPNTGVSASKTLLYGALGVALVGMVFVYKSYRKEH
ncbi:C69 family dipeptidase [Erysipelothrix rhusiopathiae]|uniref:C69 family dipeptidase n=1 Tax=Erysipelothrix sp. strain 2 (EsS2-7-Brazil) TaxID=2500579 RepID=UPI00137750B1|nr:C69 family dipeptidase [Erysipelothrix sp. strain 2 (EsS2-7-Brazil)]MBK2403291.1 C69 family dipeptidase [Erysipelothrix sp. strain 2 (EsS2-7-Brazil)]NBA00741.1 C69 family dipeptidase [Erysipelothrix rhusiopathiae]